MYLVSQEPYKDVCVPVPHFPLQLSGQALSWEILSLVCRPLRLCLSSVLVIRSLSSPAPTSCPQNLPSSSCLRGITLLITSTRAGPGLSQSGADASLQGHEPKALCTQPLGVLGTGVLSSLWSRCTQVILQKRKQAQIGWRLA